jgi:TRAP-type C4-dicarboxylate transport system permease small subunit
MWKKLQEKVDALMTAIAAILIAIMMLIIVANVILRLIPAVGGFSWYMEFGQYSNVWAMLIAAVGIAAAGTNLRVEVIDSVLKKWKYGYKFTRIIIDVAELIFYFFLTYSGYMLATKARQKVSTMPIFTMGQVYIIFPIAGALCIAAVFIHLMATITTKAGEEKVELDESQQ